MPRLVLIELAEQTILVPDVVQVNINGRRVTITGPKGTLNEDLSHLPVKLLVENGSLHVSASWARKREAALVGTAAAHLRNMIHGVTSGFTYKLKTVYAHFPITVKVQDKEKKIIIENFIGEKTPRIAEIKGQVAVKVTDDEIHVQGIKLEDVSQTASNIQLATKIKEKDQRVFLDGIYIFEKSKGN